MKTKKIVVSIVILVVLAILVRWKLRPQLPGASHLSETNESLTSLRSTGSTAPTTPPNVDQLSNSGRPPTTPGTNAIDPHLAELTRKFIEEMRNDPAYMFKVSIRFYGKVLDQDEMPVAGADVGFKWNRMNAINNEMESGEAGAKTDGGGLFSLEEQKGGQLAVTVSKPGYYSLGENRSMFEYAQPYSGNFYIPDPNYPVVFHLRKKGNGVALITSRSGTRDDFGLSIPIDGAPIKVDLLQRNTGVGPLEISQLKPDPKLWKQASEWSFRMEIPDGGFVEYHEEFPFEAPETGYQPIMQLNFQNNQTNWSDGVKSDYYIRFGNPPLYGRLHLETFIDEKGARLTYAINPDGKRNLEPQ